MATVTYSLLDKVAMDLLSQGDWATSLPRSLALLQLIMLGNAALFVPFAIWRTSKEAWIETWTAAKYRVVFGSLMGITSYALILEAFREASVSYVTSVRQTSVVFATLLAVGVLGETPSRARLLGIGCVFLGVVMIAFGG